MNARITRYLAYLREEHLWTGDDAHLLLWSGESYLGAINATPQEWAISTFHFDQLGPFWGRVIQERVKEAKADAFLILWPAECKSSKAFVNYADGGGFEGYMMDLKTGSVIPTKNKPDHFKKVKPCRV